MANWMDYLANPRAHQLKKVMFEFLKERYAVNEQIIERVGASLTTEKDSRDFLKLVTDVYELAYLKAVADHREQLQKMGITARVRSENS
ncbi:MAG: hypothetical protein EBS89_14725 [Proteobacteria bacterium]|nr:hypothetical protein [Pseudomonadota bacterium]